MSTSKMAAEESEIVTSMLNRLLEVGHLLHDIRQHSEPPQPKGQTESQALNQRRTGERIRRPKPPLYS